MSDSNNIQTGSCDTHLKTKDEHIDAVLNNCVAVSNAFAASMIAPRRDKKLRVPFVNSKFDEAAEKLTNNFFTLAWQNVRICDDVSTCVDEWLKDGIAGYRFYYVNRKFGWSEDDFREVALSETGAYANLCTQRDKLIEECHNNPKSTAVEYTWEEVFTVSRDVVRNSLSNPNRYMGYTTFVKETIKSFILSGYIKPGLVGSRVHALLKKELGDVYEVSYPNFVNRAMDEAGYQKGAFARKNKKEI